MYIEIETIQNNLMKDLIKLGLANYYESTVTIYYYDKDYLDDINNTEALYISRDHKLESVSRKIPIKDFHRYRNDVEYTKYIHFS